MMVVFLMLLDNNGCYGLWLEMMNDGVERQIYICRRGSLFPLRHQRYSGEPVVTEYVCMYDMYIVLRSYRRLQVASTWYLHGIIWTFYPKTRYFESRCRVRKYSTEYIHLMYIQQVATYV